MKILSFILAGGEGSELGILTRHRAKTAVPFGGRYRIIDFCLSNCVNSGIQNIYVLAQYNPRSLIEHIGMGKPWDLDRKTGGIYIMQPSHHGRVAQWYRGTAEALFQNAEIIGDSDADLVLVLSGDQVYKMDYREMVNEHMNNSKPVTVACRKAPEGRADRLGMVDIDGKGMITDFQEKPEVSSYTYASLGIYLFDRRFLLDCLNRDTVDIVFDIIKPSIEDNSVSSYILNGYWEDIGSVDTYYMASMKLLKQGNFLENGRNQLFTRESGMPPTKICESAQIKGSIIADGCRICGKAEGSIIFPGVTVEKGADVAGSIIFQRSVLKEGAKVYNSIIDKEVIFGEEASVGDIPGKGSQITLIGKGTEIERCAVIEAGAMIEPRSEVKGNV